MKIHDTHGMRMSANFLCVEEKGDDGQFNRKPCATGFLVSVPIGPAGVDIVYLVTARHVVDQSRSWGKLYLRLNENLWGGFSFGVCDQDLFVTHLSNDVATIPLSLIRFEGHGIQIATVDYDALATAEFSQRNRIREGNEVFISGLFSERPGSTINQSIIRFGKVALMPINEEKINIQLSPESKPLPVDAFLVESLSWGGESGSPVFMQFPGEPNFHLVGLVHGHYPIKQSVIEKNQKVGEVDLNAGIMIVIPSQAIIDTLMQEDLVKQREEIKKKYLNSQPVPVPDIKKPTKLFTREDFMRDLNKVVKKKEDKKPPKSS